MKSDSKLPSGPSAAEEWRPKANPWLIACAVMLGTFLEILDTTVVSVAIPNIAGSLAATNEEATRVLTCYLIANAIVLPASAWLSLRFGRKRFLLACTGLFTFASFLCGIAPSMGFLLLAAALQGIGGGAMVPLSQAILLESFPPAKRGMAMAMFGLGVVVAPVVGPVLGGWLTDNYSWRWIFEINIPIGIAACILMARYVEDPPYIRDAKPGPLDGVGLGFLSLWLATLQIVLDNGQRADWFGSAWIVWLTVISVAALAMLLVRELRTKNPLIDLRVFLDRNFWIGSALMTVLCAAMYSSIIGLPLFLQTLMGYSAELSGLATAPRGIGAAIAMPVAGYLMSYVDGRRLIVFGVCLLGLASFLLGGVNLDISAESVVWPCVVQGIGIGFAMVPLMTLAMSTLRNEQIGNASGLFNLVRNVGGSIGIAMTTTYLARGAQSHYSLMVSHLTPYDPVYQQRLAALQGGLTPLAGAPQAQHQAHGIVQGIVLQQASLSAFIDTFYWTALALALCIPWAFLMKKVLSRGTVAAH